MMKKIVFVLALILVLNPTFAIKIDALNTDVELQSMSNGNYFGQSEFYVEFYPNPSPRLYDFEYGEYELQLDLFQIQGYGNIIPTSTIVENNKIYYNFGSNSYLSYTVKGSEVKELIKFSENDIPTKVNDLVFKYRIKPTNDLELIKEETRLAFYNNSTLIFHIPKPYVTDSAGKEIKLEFDVKEVGQNTFYEYTIPKEFLGNAIFPIFIDPTVIIDSSYRPYSNAMALDSNGYAHIFSFNKNTGYAKYFTDKSGSWVKSDMEDWYAGNLNEYGSDVAIDNNDNVFLLGSDNGGGGADYIDFCKEAGAGWSCEGVHGGRGGSLAIDSSNVKHISFVDQADWDLWYCYGSYGSWTCEEVQAGTFYDTSIAIDSNDDVRIAYYDSPNALIKQCNGTYSTSWSCDTVYDATIIGSTGVNIQNGALTIDSNDISHIGYYEVLSSGNRSVKHGWGNYGSWSNEIIYNSTDLQPFWIQLTKDENDNLYSVFGLNETSTDNAILETCDNIKGYWECSDFLTEQQGYFRMDRSLAIAKGRICDTTSYSRNAHLVWTNDTYDLMYSTYDIGDPRYSDDTVSLMVANLNSTMSLNWTSQIGLDSYMFAFDNGTGSFVNDSWISSGFSGSDSWSNTTKQLNSTVNSTIRWKYYANNTNGGITESTIFTFNSIPSINFVSENITTSQAFTYPFWVNVTTNRESQTGLLDLYLNIDGTDYLQGTIDCIAGCSEGTTFYRTKNVKVPTLAGDYDFYWWIDGSTYRYENYTLTVQQYDIDNCEVYTDLIYNFTFWDELDRYSKFTSNNSIELFLNFTDIGLTLGDLNTSVDYFPICVNINDTVVDIDLIVEFTRSTGDYRLRRYIDFDSEINTSETQNIRLYQIETAESLPFILYAVDSSEQPFNDGNVVVRAMRNYIEDNIYITVDSCLTSTVDGGCLIYIDPNDAWYKFVFLIEGIIIEQTNQMQIYESSKKFILNPEPVSKIFEIIGMSFEHSWINATSTYSLTINNVGSLENIDLHIYEVGMLSNPAACSNSANVSGGTVNIYCTIPGSTSEKTYFVKVYGTFSNGLTLFLYNDYLNFRTSAIGGEAGLFGAMILILILGLGGLWLAGYNGMIFFTCMGFVLSSFGGLLELGIYGSTVVLSVCAIGGILILLGAKNG